MKQLTKKAYSRKAIIIGAVAFSAIALTATGVAAFVLSASSESNPQGGLHVGVVADKSINIKIPNMGAHGSMSDEEDAYKYVIDFDPDKDDNSGRIRYDGTNHEKLSNTVTGEISPKDVVTTSTVTAKLTMGNYLTNASEWQDDSDMMANFKNATEKGYITLPDCFDNEVRLQYNGSDNYKLTERGNEDICDFSVTFSFGWGSFFNYMNPGNYYDEDPVGKAKDDDTMKKEMKAFQDTLFYGKDQEQDLKISYKLTIKVDTTTSSTATSNAG